MTVNKQQLDSWLAAKADYDKARSLAVFGRADVPHMYEWVEPNVMSAIERCVGMTSKLRGDGALATRVLDYSGCTFQCAAGRAD